MKSHHRLFKENVMTRTLRNGSILLLTGFIIHSSIIAGDKGDHMKTLNLKTEIGPGKDHQVDVLFEGPRRKIVQITLRNNAILESHKAIEPITIQCVAGKGTLTVGDEKRPLELVPGVLVTIEPKTVHEIHSHPAVSILLSKFGEK